MGTTSPKAVIMDETAVNRAMTRIAHEILERNEGCEDLALVGIVTRGDLLAKKLAEEIKEIEGVDVPLGSLDISFYRDDYATNFAPAIHATNIPFSVDGKRVVLVDHNEASQSVVGLDQVDILEIIDHHRLADIQTRQPISVRNEPVGSTNTIITAMYQENGVMPSPRMAGLMAAAILSDTVMFKSPTCTERDRKMAERLARMADISLDELGKAIFSGSIGGKSAEELLYTDYKEFHIAGHDFAVSQITCVDSPSMLERKEEFLDLMRKKARKEDLTMVILMLTDVLLEGTQLIYVGDDDTIQQAFGVTPKDGTVFLPRVMSRKKQIIPMLSALWG